MVRDVIDSFSPGYGAMSSVNLTMQALGTTPRAIPYQTLFGANARICLRAGSGTVKRLAQGLPTTVNRVSFTADVAAASGAEVAFGLYRNGVAVPGAAMTLTGGGAGNFALASIGGGFTTLDGQDYTYEIRAAKISGAVDDVVLSQRAIRRRNRADHRHLKGFAMLFVPLTRTAADVGYSTLFYLNIDQSLSMVRAVDNTHTRIRGPSVITPAGASAESVIEVLVVETPEQIATLINSARPGARMVVRT